MLSTVKCSECSGRLEGNMTVCPFCGSRQEIDLRKVNFRDLGTDKALPCPDCENSLNIIEFDTDPTIRIERCSGCFGMFFNPGELEALVESKTNDFVWLDKTRINGISENYGYNHEVIYLKCPMCSERMSHINFGGSSGVILDQCGTHGVWLQGGELKRLMEWWPAGGKHLYQQNEQERIAKLAALRLPPTGSKMKRSPSSDIDWTVLDAVDRDRPLLDTGNTTLDTITLIGHALIGILTGISD